jgi:chemotaxis protein methyltransferase CheR
MAATAVLAVSVLPSPITAKEFALFQALIHREAGIYLSEPKKALVVGRLARRLRDLGLGSFAAYHQVVQEDAEELVRMLDCISTNETHFFREPRQFEFLEQRVFPEWTSQAAAGLRPRRVRVWSAGCSTGEEPYSLAMALLLHFPPSAGWEIDILGTDLSTRVLKRARAGVWPIEKTREIPPRYLKPFMLKGVGSQEGKIKAGPEIQALVCFQRLNLNETSYAVNGPFDLVFCRNVLIYFDPPSKIRVVHRLLGQLASDGYLFLGHAESLTGLTDRTRSVGPTVYVHAARATSPATVTGARGRPLAAGVENQSALTRARR